MTYSAYLKNESGARVDVGVVTTSIEKMRQHIKANYGKGWTATIMRGEDVVKRWMLR